MIMEITKVGSKHTTLVVSNLRDSGINNISTSVSSNNDWDGDSRPDHNFNNVSIAGLDALGQREELNDPLIGSLKDGTFSMNIRYADGRSIAVTNNQKDALTKFRRIIATNDGIEICQTSGADTNGFEIRDVSPPDNSRWMENLLVRRPTVRLNDITIPGSHDAGMYTVRETWKCSNEDVQTQDDPFLKQLKSGSRYFDVRVWFYNNDFYTYHGEDHVGMFIGGEGGKLEDILHDVNTFIESYGPKETIILKFSHTYSNVDKWKLLSYILDNCKYAYKTSSIGNFAELPLSTTQGKVLLVFDNGEFSQYIDPIRGVLPYRNWNNCEYGFKVFDEYTGTSKYNVMVYGDASDNKVGQLEHLQQYGGYGQSFLFLFSWTLTGSAGLVDIGVLSSLCRPWLPQYLQRMKNGELKKPNIIYIDFLDPWVGRAIININD